MSQFHSHKHKQLGFTLLEVLLAVAIFALVASASFMMLQQTLKAGDIFERKSDDLATLQRAYRVMQNDFSQPINRAVQDEYGDPLPAVMTESMSWGLALELTVAGRRNPLDKPRSNLQRVRYFFDGDNLVRRTWSRLDRAPESTMGDQILISNVKTWQLRFLVNGNWVEELQYVDGQSLNLQAVDVQIGLNNQRTFDWLFSFLSFASESTL
jgi:general secretion pathway protein J